MNKRRCQHFPRAVRARPQGLADRAARAARSRRLLLGNALVAGVLTLLGCSSVGIGIGIPIGIGGLGVTINSDGTIGGSVGVGVGGVNVGVGGTARVPGPAAPASAPAAPGSR